MNFNPWFMLIAFLAGFLISWFFVVVKRVEREVGTTTRTTALSAASSSSVRDRETYDGGAAYAASGSSVMAGRADDGYEAVDYDSSRYADVPVESGDDHDFGSTDRFVVGTGAAAGAVAAGAAASGSSRAGHADSKGSFLSRLGKVKDNLVGQTAHLRDEVSSRLDRPRPDAADDDLGTTDDVARTEANPWNDSDSAWGTGAEDADADQVAAASDAAPSDATDDLYRPPAAQQDAPAQPAPQRIGATASQHGAGALAAGGAVAGAAAGAAGVAAMRDADDEAAARPTTAVPERPLFIETEPDEHPIGYTVKGDKKAKLYLVSSDPDFERAKPDIWFVDERAALEQGYAHYIRKPKPAADGAETAAAAEAPQTSAQGVQTPPQSDAPAYAPPVAAPAPAAPVSAETPQPEAPHEAPAQTGTIPPRADDDESPSETTSTIILSEPVPADRVITVPAPDETGTLPKVTEPLADGAHGDAVGVHDNADRAAAQDRSDQADQPDEAPYGAGSARAGHDGQGPQGWFVKGNEDSMLYHTPDSPSYRQTKAEVWFRTEQDAESAGFDRWDSHQR